MTKYAGSKLIRSRAMILALIVLTIGFSQQAYCQTKTTALLIQQTPVNGGTVTPEMGIYDFELDSEITLTAVPKPGYRFVYWIGNVSDATKNITVINLDSAKIVIAVFERTGYDFAAFIETPKSQPGGGLRGSSADYARSGGGGITKNGDARRQRPMPDLDPEDDPFPVPQEPIIEDDDFPVPQELVEDDDFPVPDQVPEPATVILLGMGSMMILRKFKGESGTEKK